MHSQHTATTAPAGRVAALLSALTLVILVLATLWVPPAAAAPGGNKGPGGSKGPSGGATLVATPDEVAMGEEFTLTGCGYDDTAPVDFVITTPSRTWFFSVATDGRGCVSVTKLTQDVGNYDVDANQLRNGRKSRTMASTTLTVTP